MDTFTVYKKKKLILHFFLLASYFWKNQMYFPLFLSSKVYVIEKHT